MDNPEKKLSRENIETMISAGGGVIGFLSLGPIGGILGNALTRMMLSTYKEFLQRSRSTKQQESIEMVLTTSYLKLKEEIQSGKEIRSDGFISSDHLASPAKELLDTIMKESFETNIELKNKHLALFFTNTLLVSGFSGDNAFYMLKVFSDLTVRQLTLMKLFSEETSIKNILRRSSYKDQIDTSSFDTISTCQEIINLYDLGLVIGKEFKPTTLIHYWWNVKPSDMILTKSGREFYSIFQLSEIDKSKVLEIVEVLR